MTRTRLPREPWIVAHHRNNGKKNDALWASSAEHAVVRRRDSMLKVWAE
jgi:hypothetical protein